MTAEQIERHKKNIDGMSQRSMCSLHRFAPTGHPYFDMQNTEIREHWVKRFKELGGFTPAISKSLG